jgi:transposase
MRHVREVLRLKTAGVSGNEIARRLNLAPSTARLTLQRLATVGLGWPLPAELTDAALEAQLFTAVGTKQGHRRLAEPDWAEVHRELKRKHVTLQILWDEYIERQPEGYRYSRFCELYRSWASRLSVTMRQSHAGGDKLFVDYAGDTVPVVVDRLTGKTRPAEIFVAVWAPRTSPMPRRAGRRCSATGSAPTPAPLRRSAARPGCWCRTTPRSR